MTYSIVARDPATGDLGCAVQSKFLGVGAGIIHPRAKIGAVVINAPPISRASPGDASDCPQ